jgi:hypothetical protein
MPMNAGEECLFHFSPKLVAEYPRILSQGSTVSSEVRMEFHAQQCKQTHFAHLLYNTSLNSTSSPNIHNVKHGVDD